ncbi:AarF/UbiB family protein [Actinosynnema sp. NPDC047251]|uniref:ABC1 kinase family protein n=1 Tax=Saccharothrix espanaensis TaxID=103731 RepID=UPI00130DF270|nr:AarF/UbiB family protein [Saccharothrix espanaensis]
MDRTRARRVRATLEQLGPFYIKVGQMLSTRPDIVSQATAEELRGLHDRVEARPFGEFEPVLRAGLGRRWRGMFTDFDTENPIGSASLAQVYAATLTDGRPVAVKVQRPDIAPLIAEDMALLRRAARLLAVTAPGFTELVDVRAMLDMLFEAMRSELDFTREAVEADRARAEVLEYKHLDVPEVYEASPTVMVQSLAPGCSIADARPEEFTTAERVGIGRDLMAFMFSSYFTTKVFHADPHPGNVFVQPGSKASLLDWGMVGRIDHRTSLGMLRMLLNVALNDALGVTRAWVDMGRATERADVAAFRNDMELLVPSLTTVTLDRLDFGATFTSVLGSSTRHGIRTNPAIALLGKSFANLEGSIRYLAPELSVVGTFRDQLQDIMIDIADEAISEARLADVTLELLTNGTQTLHYVHTALRQLIGGEMVFRVERANRLDRHAGRRRSLFAVVAGAFLWSTHKRLARSVSATALVDGDQT